MSGDTDVVTNQFTLINEQETINLAHAFAFACEATNAVNKGLIVYLKGDLGAGKSFFSRAFIQNFLPGQKVKSPTYTIVESYKTSTVTIHHFDLYRLCDPEELEYLAIRDLLMGSYVALVEWPQKGEPIFPEADVVIELQHPQEFESENRRVEMTASSVLGGAVVEQLMMNMRK
ncbi:tRNA (adenosine(37)-N6)-threonylcarbamoyltransferase complex ATPase subunit type 1 TsaE [Thiomicrorhabdus arctica]|uniref:tRNA (adenosine(37)-N6)-threonylcarbamoyltransferase complex ATPase subunit type 1 TsaE n=1 Tax=Thiomicrorhabdus arctica TaxID=131540 RepID=UPI00035F7B91|nr:tRNA (adenosine(37)-N6)-threonylcarbamoyltransferase complex ATPase subunit type 1 TsaE [Thiomicrorhabdus arctica]